MAKQCYRYEPLPGPRDIRLLELLPGSGQDPISVALHICSINAKPDFEALSYVWGDRGCRLPIFCGDARLDITKNLHAALSRFRLPSSPRFLWVDAVCINQADLGERAAQVQLMHLIYSSCRTCLVWLGPSDEHSVDALKVILDISAIVCRRAGVSPEELDGHLEREGRDMLQAQEMGFNGLPSPDSRAWGSLFHLFNRPWFSRIWVSDGDRRVSCRRTDNWLLI